MSRMHVVLLSEFYYFPVLSEKEEKNVKPGKLELVLILLIYKTLKKVSE